MRRSAWNSRRRGRYGTRSGPEIARKESAPGPARRKGVRPSKARTPARARAHVCTGERITVPIRVLELAVVVTSLRRQIGVALTVASVSFLVGCGAALGSQSQPAAASPRPGTYEIRICNAPCDPAASNEAYVSGFLVLEASPYSAGELEEAARHYRNKTRFLLREANGQPNACFALNRRPMASGHAGIRPAALTRWVGDQTGAGVTILLYRSADASYTAHLTRQSDELRGRGVSRGGFEPGDVIPIDSIHARRVGPVDRNLCLQRAATDTVGLPRSTVPVPGWGETPAPPPAAQRVP